MPCPSAGEITECEPHNGYLIFPGGIPEVGEFIRKLRKQARRGGKGMEGEDIGNTHGLQ
jgi:hypothetical protein